MNKKIVFQSNDGTMFATPQACLIRDLEEGLLLDLDPEMRPLVAKVIEEMLVNVKHRDLLKTCLDYIAIHGTG
jgi:hypothetical protein